MSIIEQTREVAPAAAATQRMPHTAVTSETPKLREVLMLDLLATVPYYTAYLSRALLGLNVPVRIGSIDYYLDPTCFSSRGLRLRPGLLNVVGRFLLPAGLRRILKLTEMCLNLAALSIRSVFRPTDVVHVQYLPLLRWPVPLDDWFVRWSQRRGSRVVLTVHDLLPHDTAERYKGVFQRQYERADALICHSGHVKGRLLSEFGIPEYKVHVIPHGPFFYDQPAASPETVRAKFGIPADRALVLWQGIIFPYKGLDLLLSAWQVVERDVSAAHLIVVGTGSPELLASLRQQVQDLGLTRVTLDLRFASTQELVDVYRAADVVVYPYRAITTSGALATGLALGKAVVASDLPVFRELLTDGENALLVPPADPPALAKAITRLLQDEPVRRGFEARVQGMNFGAESWQAIARDTVEVYRFVLERKQGI